MKPTQFRGSRTPSPRNMNRNGNAKHTNGTSKEDRPNGLALNFDSDMETEVVLDDDEEEDETGEEDCGMDVDMPVGAEAADGHLNGAAAASSMAAVKSAHNGDVPPQSMDFDDEDEENKVVAHGDPTLLKRTLEFGRHLNEFSAKIPESARTDLRSLASVCSS